MKRKSIISLFIGLLGFSVTTTSCEDMLTPDMDRYAEGFSGKDTVAFYMGILSNLQDVAEQNFLLGEIRGDLVDTTMYCSDSIAAIANFDRQPDGENIFLNRAAYYKVINQCNYYLASCQTDASKNDVRYMRKEFAQVELIRAWTYMQLVQAYGEVPFITQPVDNADTGWETNSPEGTVNASNLIDKLESRLQQAALYEKTEGYPSYGDLTTGGGVTVPFQRVLFYSDLVLGDLYLMRGRDRSDYIKAANYYHEYLEKYKGSRRIQSSYRTYFSQETYGSRITYRNSCNSWITNQFADAEQTGNGSEAITVIPSASNVYFGKVLAQLPQIYGFDVTTSASTTGSSTNDAGTVTGSVSGSISTYPNYKNRQIGPSQKYLNLCADQSYTEPVDGSSGSVVDAKFYEGTGDARVAGSAPLVTTKIGKLRFIHKYNPSVSVNNDEAYGFSFRYMKSIYRLSQVMLRYAEAINRAGYPRHAFAILRDGFTESYKPALGDSIRYYEETQPDGSVLKYKQHVYYVDSLYTGRSLNYLSTNELRKAINEGHANTILSCRGWGNSGIHELGCGRSSDYDSLYSYQLKVSQRIEDEAKRTGRENDPEVLALVKRLREEGKNPVKLESVPEPDDEALEAEYVEVAAYPEYSEPTALEINAVETLIADEMALETAFEGTRFFDLVRIASHKNNDASSPSGTDWLAWLVSRRSLNLKPYENVWQTGSLFGILQSPANWYLRNPEY